MYPDHPDLPVPRRRPRARLVGLTVATVGVLALTACGGGSKPAAQGTSIQPGAGQSLAGRPGSTATGPVPSASSMPGMPMPSTAGVSSAAAAPVAGNAVAIKNFAFAPAALTVKVGTTVTWTNQDSDAHTVTSMGKGGPLKSSPLNTGQSYTHTFTAAGTYSYLCTVHPFMTATVTVTP